MQYPYSEYNEVQGEAGSDNTAWGNESTDQNNSKPVE